MAEHEDDWIRQRAYALWEEEGRPSGKDAAHWEQAKREHGAAASEVKTGSDPSPASTAPSAGATEPVSKKVPAKKSSQKSAGEKKPGAKRPGKPSASS